MATPPSRRLGHSRKAHYGIFFGYVAAIAGVLVALLLIAAAIFDPHGFGAIRSIAMDATTPASAAGRGTVRGTRSMGETIGAYIDAGTKNRAMAAELQARRAQISEARAIAYENIRLRRLLALGEERPGAVATARIVGSTPSSSRRFAILSAGRMQGVQTGMPVISADGLIGRVAVTGHISARVTLLTDGGSVVPVRRARDGLPAIATGTGDGALDIRALATGENPFKAGDLMVTSGIGGVYPPNIPVGVVLSLKDDGAIGRPRADPARIDFAIVEPPFQPRVQEQAQILSETEPEAE